MVKIIVVLALSLTGQSSFAQDQATPTDAPKANPTGTKAPTQESISASEEKKEEEFKPPRGFKTKKRGDLVLYCQTDATVGTRFKTEKCYNEEQLRAYILVLEAQKRDVDRIRTNCGGGPCTPYEPASPAR
jgi:hypothetical protein